jgi:hypothetical protein
MTLRELRPDRVRVKRWLRARGNFTSLLVVADEGKWY